MRATPQRLQPCGLPWVATASSAPPTRGARVAGLIRLPLQLLLKHALQGAARERPRLHRLRYRPPGGGAAFAWQSWGCYGGDSPPPPILLPLGWRPVWAKTSCPTSMQWSPAATRCQQRSAGQVGRLTWRSPMRTLPPTTTRPRSAALTWWGLTLTATCRDRRGGQ